MKNLLIIFSLLVSGLTVSGCGMEATSQAEAQENTQTDVVDGVIKNAAVLGAAGAVAVDAGFATNGTIIAIPTGFTADQCRFTAAVATIDGNAISVSASINDETGEVICEKVVQDRPEIPAQTRDCTASYTILCTK